MLSLSLICSIDSFLAAASIGLLGCPDRYKRRLALGFMTCDMLATVAGARLHIGASNMAIAVATAAAILVLSRAAKRPAFYMLIPVLLCLDNLAAGAMDAVATPQSIAVTGVMSGLFAWAGFALTQTAVRVLPNRVAVCLGLAALGLTLVH